MSGAAVFGLIDWLAIPSGTRAKRIGLLHGGTNVLVVALFAFVWWSRNNAVEPLSGLPAAARDADVPVHHRRAS